MATITESQEGTRPKAHAGRGSWIDRLSAAIERLPAPAWAVYLAVGLSAYAVLIAVLASGGQPVERAAVAAAPLAIALGGWLWLASRFDAGARRAMADLGPHRLRDPSRFEALEDELTMLPSIPTALAGAAVAVIAAVRVQASPGLLATWGGPAAASPSIVLAIVFGMVAFAGSAYALKILMQSWRIHRLLTHEVKIDLFDVAPLYGFSRLTATMAVSVIVSLLVFVVPVPGAALGLVAFVGSFVPIGLAMLAFLLPLVGVHGRLVDEKERLLSITRDSIQAAGASLRHAIQESALSRMDPLQKALAGLEIEQRLISAQPTWPWQPETFRWVVGALMFPVVLYLLQLFIQRFVPA